MSPAVTVPEPRLLRRTSISGDSPWSRATRFFRAEMMSTTSSRTPGKVVNSCATPSIFTEVTAAPSSDESSTRRSELPNVWPKPRSSGSITKTPRRSSTSSWTIRGIWKSIRLVRVAKAILPSLLRIELDDELFLDGGVDLAPLWPLEHLAGEALVVGLEPRGDGSREVGRVPDHLLGGAARRHRDDVDVEVAVTDELAGLSARGGESETVDDVVKPRLEHPQQGLARDPRALRGLRVVVAELLLEQAVVAARLLLLAQLEQILGLLDAAAAVLAWRVAATLDRALLGEAALALQEELHALAAAPAALRAESSGH